VYTIEELQSILGLTRRQVRERLAALAAHGQLLDGQVRLGPHGRKLYSVAVLQMLRDLDEMSKTSGLTLDQAAEELAAKIKGNVGGERVDVERQGDGNVGQLNGQLALLQTLVEDLRRERDYWRDLALKLQEQVRELEKLALPAPREHKPWWARGIFRWLWG